MSNMLVNVIDPLRVFVYKTTACGLVQLVAALKTNSYDQFPERISTAYKINPLLLW